jgi:Flp pilus assembly pilin Flp
MFAAFTGVKEHVVWGMGALKRLLRDRSDSTALEYCLIAAVIVVANIAGIQPFVAP